ncbi:cytochrome P450 [Hypoxylon crocopeplum]|nr:cytochrome P450 [Hypoxylon crocopeplum]
MESWDICLIALPLVCLAYLVATTLSNNSSVLPENVPISGLRNELFKVTRVSFRQLTNGVSTLLDGYKKYSIRGQVFILCEPSMQKELMLPPEHVRWFGEQSDSTMSSKTIREERHASKYLHMGVEFSSTLYFMDRVIRDSLTRNLDDIQEPLCDEISRGFDEVFGIDSAEWKTLNVYQSMQEIILRAMCRVFFGEQISRNQEFLTTYSRYILAMGVGTMIIGILPKFMKRLLVPMFNVPLWYYRRRTLRILLPVVEQQVSQSLIDNNNYDFISQCARTSAKSTSTKTAAEPKLLAEWMMLLGFAAFNSLGGQTSNVLLDILYSPAELQVYEALREEAEAALESQDDWNNAAIFNALQTSDSVIRESLRCHPMLIKGLTKEVVRKGGLDLPEGTHVAEGAWLGVPVLGIHRDARFYPNPESYDPFRYLKLRGDRQKGSTKGLVPTKDLDAGNPTSTYLGFGYGRHACPGRWYSVLMMKAMLAYLVINYDVKPIGSQPTMKVLGDAALPPISATVRVRRRKIASA